MTEEQMNEFSMMKKGRYLELTREDLTLEARKNLSLEEIQYYHIKGTVEWFKKASKVEFIDDDGKTKVLKKR